MKHLQTKALLLLMIAALSTPAHASVGITAKVGTLGLGAEVTVPLAPDLLNARVAYNAFEWSYDREEGESGLEGNLHLETIPVLLDLHPFHNNFRLSGGPVINNNSVAFHASESGTVTANDNSYATVEVDGGITFDDMAWYAGLGFGNAASKGRLHFAFDFGVMFHGEPQAEATATASDPAYQDALNRDLAEEVAEVQDDIEDFRFYPVLSFGISLTF